MRHSLFLSLCLLMGGSFMAAAQQAVDLGQVSLSKWKIGTGNYSGIAPMGDGRYAVVSDKEPADGFFVFRIDRPSGKRLS